MIFYSYFTEDEEVEEEEEEVGEEEEDFQAEIPQLQNLLWASYSSLTV